MQSQPREAIAFEWFTKFAAQTIMGTAISSDHKEIRAGRWEGGREGGREGEREGEREVERGKNERNGGKPSLRVALKRADCL